MSNDDDVRIIKKYPNRRLYDTAISSYITLADVKRLVLDGVDFRVVEAKTRDDLTRTILLQIISEEEEGGEPIFSSELLAQIIRSYGGNMQNLLSDYLEKSMDLWSEQQRTLREQAREFMGSSNNPMAMLNQIAERNLRVWRQMSGLDQYMADSGNDGQRGRSNKGSDKGSDEGKDKGPRE